jgi:hypothetical protein
MSLPFPGDARRLAAFVLLVLGAALPLYAQSEDSVVNTVHNLSVSGPGEVRSTTETEVCKFCHIPHNAVEPQPLWGHALSTVQHYQVPELRQKVGSDEIRRPAPQPDGASRLCLSCHDGTVALGDVAGERQPIPFAGSQRLGPGRRGYIGTDLSGSHPVSFVLRDEGLDSDEQDVGMRSLSFIQGDQQVRLDHEGKMQCTTCHDPHSDRYYVDGRVPHFWVKPTVDEVCLTCHELR